MFSFTDKFPWEEEEYTFATNPGYFNALESDTTLENIGVEAHYSKKAAKRPDRENWHRVLREINYYRGNEHMGVYPSVLIFDEPVDIDGIDGMLEGVKTVWFSPDDKGGVYIFASPIEDLRLFENAKHQGIKAERYKGRRSKRWGTNIIRPNGTGNGNGLRLKY